MNLAPFIDHTLLRFDAEISEFDVLCTDALKYGFASVCIPPSVVGHIKKHFQETDLKVGTVIGFPCGYSTYKTKVAETQEMLLKGIDELDFVINLQQVHSGLFDFVEKEIEIFVNLCREKEVICKVIIEIGSLAAFQFQKICEIINKLHPDYIKTSTGMLKTGYVVSLDDIASIEANVDKTIKIKASGGIRTKEHALKLVLAGADRIGTSSSIKIIQ